jgi:type I restriction enzyme M protein
VEILGWVQKSGDVQDRDQVVSLKEIQEEECRLNISRYVMPPIGAVIPPSNVAIADFKAALEHACEAEERLCNIIQEDGWLEEH